MACRAASERLPPIRFTLRQLEYFVATCDAGSVTDAALGIPLAQLSVSSAIAQLEAALGVQLLIPHHAQGVASTPAGRQLLDRARALLCDAEELERSAAELTDEPAGTLELGCMITLAPLATPRLCSLPPRASGRDRRDGGGRPGGDRRPPAHRRAHAGDHLRPLAGARPRVRAADHLAAARRLRRRPPARRPGVGRARRAGGGTARAARSPAQPRLLPHPLRGRVAPTVRQRSQHPEVIRTLVANGFGYTIVNALPAIDRALDGREVRTVPIAGDRGR